MKVLITSNNKAVRKNGVVVRTDTFANLPVQNGLIAWFRTDITELELVSGNVAGCVNMAPAAIKNVDSLNDSTNTITDADNDVANGDIVYLSGTLPAGFSTLTKYYVINRTSTTFQLSATSGGSAVDFTGTSAGLRYHVNNAVQTTLANQPEFDGSQILTTIAGEEYLDINTLTVGSISSRYSIDSSGTTGNAIVGGVPVGDRAITQSNAYAIGTAAANYYNGNVYVDSTSYLGSESWFAYDTYNSYTEAPNVIVDVDYIGASGSPNFYSELRIKETMIYNRKLLATEAYYNNSYLDTKYA